MELEFANKVAVVTTKSRDGEYGLGIILTKDDREMVGFVSTPDVPWLLGMAASKALIAEGVNQGLRMATDEVTAEVVAEMKTGEVTK